MISKEDIAGLATLARLELSDIEVASLQKDVSNILDFVGQLEHHSIDSTGISRGSAPSVPLLRTVMREDALRAQADQLFATEEAIRAQFPSAQQSQTGAGTFNVVRKIIQKD